VNFTSFTTKRLLLRPVHTDDAAFILELVNTTKWLKYIGDLKIYSLKKARNYIKNSLYNQLKQLGFTTNLITLTDTNQKIGICGVFYRQSELRFELGFALLPEFEKQGYAFEAAQSVIKRTEEIYAVNQLFALSRAENLESQDLLARLGFKFVCFTSLSGESEETLLFQKVNS